LELEEEELEEINKIEEEKSYEETSPYDTIVSQMFNYYSLGSLFHCLPRPGGLDDQLPLWTDCMVIINQEIKAYEADELKRTRSS
jgi:hypothetical protein